MSSFDSDAFDPSSFDAGSFDLEADTAGHIAGSTEFYIAATGSIEGVQRAQVQSSGGYFEYPMRRRPEPAEAPQVVEQEIKPLAVEANSVMSAAQMQQHLESAGLAYKQAYLEIYMGLVEEARQEKENEVIAACIAAML